MSSKAAFKDAVKAAREAIQKGDGAAALPLCKQALKIAAKDAAAASVTSQATVYVMVGLAAKLTGDDGTARAAYDKALEMTEGDLVQAWQGLLELHEAAGRGVDARACLRELCARADDGAAKFEGRLADSLLAEWRGDARSLLMDDGQDHDDAVRLWSAAFAGMDEADERRVDVAALLLVLVPAADAADRKAWWDAALRDENVLLRIGHPLASQAADRLAKLEEKLESLRSRTLPRVVAIVRAMLRYGRGVAQDALRITMLLLDEDEPPLDIASLRGDLLRCVLTNPTSPWSAVVLARLSAGRPAVRRPVRAAALKQAKQVGTVARCWSALGDEYAASSDHRNALASARRGLDVLAARDGERHARLRIALLHTVAAASAALRESDDARDALESVLAMDAGDVHARAGLARLALAAGNVAEMETAVGEMEQRNGGSAHLLACRARLRILQNRLEDAQTDADAAVAAEPETAQFHVDRAAVYWARGGDVCSDRKFLFSTLIRAVKLDTLHAEAFGMLGSYYADVANDSVRAKQCLAKAVNLDPLAAAAGERLVAMYQAAGQPSLAKTLCRDTLARNATAAWAARALGLMLAASRNAKVADEAVNLFQSVLRASDDDSTCWEQIGLIYFRQGKFRASVKAFGRVIELDAARPLAHCQRAWSFLTMGMFDEAEDAFRRTLELQADAAAAQFGLAACAHSAGLALMAQGYMDRALARQTDALARLQAFLAQHQDADGSVHKLLGDVSVALHAFPAHMRPADVPSALGAFAHALGATPTAATGARAQLEHDTAVALVLLAREAANDAGKLESAVDHARQACVLAAEAGDAATLASAWTVLGIAAMGADRPDEAQDALLRAIDADPLSAEPWDALAVLYLNHDEPEMAQEAIVQSLAVDHARPLPWTIQGLLGLRVLGCRALLGGALGSHAGVDDVYGHFERAVDLGGADAVSVLGHSLLAFHTGRDASDALVRLRTLAARQPDNVAVINLAACLLERAGLRSQAIERLRSALAAAPAAPVIDAVRCNLAAALARDGCADEADSVLQTVADASAFPNQLATARAAVLFARGQAADAAAIMATSTSADPVTRLQVASAAGPVAADIVRGVVAELAGAGAGHAHAVWRTWATACLAALDVGLVDAAREALASLEAADDRGRSPPPVALVALLACEVAVRGGVFTDARRLVKLVHARPTNADARIVLALQCYHLHRPAEAVRLLIVALGQADAPDLAADDGPWTAVVRMQVLPAVLVASVLAMGQTPDNGPWRLSAVDALRTARSCAQRIVLTDPSSAVGHVHLAMVLFAQAALGTTPWPLVTRTVQRSALAARQSGASAADLLDDVARLAAALDADDAGAVSTLVGSQMQAGGIASPALWSLLADAAGRLAPAERANVLRQGIVAVGGELVPSSEGLRLQLAKHLVETDDVAAATEQLAQIMSNRQESGRGTSALALCLQVLALRASGAKAKQIEKQTAKVRRLDADLADVLLGCAE